VNWIWFGFAVMAIGTGLALLPERTFAFAAARLPAGAVTTTMLILLLCLPATVRAQHVETAQSARVDVPRTQMEKELWQELICMCGTCGRKRIGDFCCVMAAEMRAEVATLLDQGKSKDEIYQYFIAKHGSQEPLASPIDRGFNRLAWF